ncbi:MAG: hypothetical protein ACRCYX_15595 [Dermatophilaceae bacterium]
MIEIAGMKLEIPCEDPRKRRRPWENSILDFERLVTEGPGWDDKEASRWRAEVNYLTNALVGVGILRDEDKRAALAGLLVEIANKITEEVGVDVKIGYDVRAASVGQ